jgi:ABC-type nickel/cobalt efflux system permease component RcnA
MFGVDEHIAELAGGSPFIIVAAVAILLGLRHATDPDHLTAVITLMAGDAGRRRAARQAAGIGLAWGSGHATTLILFGLPVVLFDRYLPEVVQRAAEILVGALIIGLAIRLLLRLRRSRVHAHAHRHGTVEHSHVHVHETAGEHSHAHPAPVTRSGAQAFGVGLVHGIGGTAGVGVLLLAAIPNAMQGTAALVLFSAFTAVSMAAATTCFGLVLSGRTVALRDRFTPALGVLSLAFGVWYVLGAVEIVPYVF